VKKLYFPSRKHVGHRRVSYLGLHAVECVRALIGGLIAVLVQRQIPVDDTGVRIAIRSSLELPDGFVIYVQHTHRASLGTIGVMSGARMRLCDTPSREIARPLDGLIH